MAVAFDAVGPSSSCQLATTVSAFTWTHTAGTGGGTVLVFLTAGLTGGGAGGALGSFASVTYGGNAMTLLGSVAGNNSTFGGTFCYGITGQASGANTVSVGAYTVPTGATFSQTIGASLSFTGGSSFGTFFSTFGNAATGSLGVTGTTTGGMCVAGACDGTGAEAATGGGTQRFLLDQNSSSMGNTIGSTLASTGGTTTMSFSWTADFFGIAAVEVLPAGGAPPVPLPYVPQLPPCWFPGSDVVVTRPGVSPFYVPPGPAAVFIAPPPVLPDAGYLAPQPPGWFPGAPQTDPYATPFYVQPPPVPDPGAVPIPPLPPPPPTPLPPIGPYWFPGADALASCPGDIPFWIQPQPDSSPSLPPAAGLPVITGWSGTTSAAWFKDQFGNPRWMFSDTVWTIVYSAGRSGAQSWQKDMDQVVSTRASQGYTAMECNLLPNNEYIASGLTTWDGIHPFTTGTDPSSGLNDTYWQRVDYLLSSLAIHGMTLFMNLLMGEDISAGVATGWTSTQKTDYGNKVATRFLTVKNIVWMINDDGGVDATTATNILTGIRNAGDTRFIACENPQETTSRYGFKLNDTQTFGLASAQYNWVYTYAPSYGGVEYAYGEANPIPVIRGDGYYFGTIGGTDDKVAREQFWWCISSGSRGYSWGMSDGGWGAFATGWQSNLTFAGEEAGTAGDFQNNVFPAVTNYLTTLANWQKLAPDISNVFITAGRGTRAPYQTEGIQNQYTGTPADTYVSGSVATDGTLALIYFSRGAVTTITINQGLLGAGYTATWVDPANVATSPGTPGPTFTKPAGANSAGDHDWLLVLQGPAVIPAAAPGVAASLPPGWFPGADRVTAVPGGIPFAQIPAPADQNAAAAGAVTITGTASAAGAAAVTAVVTQIAPATPAAAGSVTAVVTQDAGTLTSAAGAGSVTALAVEQAPGTAAGAGSVTDVVTQAAIATAAGAAAVTDVVTQIATAAAAGAAAVTAVATQIAPATAAGAAVVTAVVTQAAPATPAGAGSVTDVVTQIVIATAAGAGAVSATPAGLLTDPAPQWQPLPPGWFPGAQAVTVDPGGIPFYAQPQPALTAPAAAVITGTASAAGAGSVTAVVTQDAGVSTTAAGAGSVTDVVTQAATAAAAGAGSVAALAAVQAPATAAGAAAVTDVVTQVVIATAAGAGAVNATGTSSGAATASAAGAAAVTALATVQAPGTATAAGSAAAVVTQQAPATAAGAATVNASGAIAGAAGITGQAAATAKAVQGVVASPAGAASLSALAAQQATAALAGAAAVNATGLSTATVVKGYSTATSVGEQAGMAAAVTEQAGMAAAVAERASSASGVS